MTKDQSKGPEVSEAEVSDAVAMAFGRAPTAGVAGQVALFEEAGLCRESAEVAARGLAEGVYFSFEDAALAQTVFDGANGKPRRNPYATSQRIAETAAKVAGEQVQS